ncbi:MAG TPA: RNA polymerase sigma factor [Pyrinomonadaceae bacterium]|nr:RNA polymerase sigma factor [Pyrinomonadaceae bacterium]
MATQPDDERERLFTDRYEDLFAFAMRLTERRRDLAEDLVQDAFVQFVLGRTRLEEIQNIDGYLKTMLRFMNISRMNRSAQLLHDESALSVADYDSCRLGWTAVEPSRRMQASEELHQICTYACSRKESSKAGSVLILRFFHDFFPTEIARILNSSRQCVDQWQKLARREAKLFMNKPGRLRFVNGKAPLARGQLKYLRPERDLMVELRQMIFNSRNGECLTHEELEEAYSDKQVDPLTTAKLAHIVSCRLCLDVVNTLLGLPLLDQRYQVEPKEPPDDVTGGGGASGDGGSGQLPQRFERRLRATREHKPQELRIAVNGFLVSSLKVTSDLNELNLNLMAGDAVQFVEIMSEQGVQLLFFSIDKHRPRREQWASVELSEERLLQASFRDEYGASLHVVYKDPLPVDASANVENPNALSSPLFIVPSTQSDLERTSQEGRLASAAGHERGLPGLFASFRARTMQLLRNARRALAADDLPEFSGLFSQPDRVRFWQRPGLVAVLVSAAIVAGFLLYRGSMSPAPSATALLERAGAAEQIIHQSKDKVSHRSIRFEERRGANGPLVAERKIETWENGAAGNRAQRLYDSSNQLIAGAWQKPDGLRTVYHHGSKPQSQPVATPDSLLLNLEDIWQLEPSALTFSSLIVEPALAQVSETSTTYVLSYEGVRTIGASRLSRATLVLSKTDLHPIEQVLVVERGGAIREYRFVEAGFELLPVSAAAPSVFEIEPELTGGAGITGRPGEWARRDLTSSRVPPSPGTSAPPPASAELEVDVAYLLNLAKADRNEQVALTRSAGGSLRVEGVVESEQRRDEFLQVLAPVRNNPAVQIEIRTISEASRSVVVVNPNAAETDQPEPTADTVAADEELRAYFNRQNPGGPVDDAIRSYSSRMVNRGYRALFHAVELKRLVDRFAGVDMRTVAPDARAKWLKMLHEHARAFERETAVLRQEIQPVFFAGSSVQAAEATTIENDGELARSADRLHQFALANNHAIRSAFTISKQSSAVAIKSATFWQSMQRAEQLAGRIAQYQAPY